MKTCSMHFDKGNVINAIWHVIWGNQCEKCNINDTMWWLHCINILWKGWIQFDKAACNDELNETNSLGWVQCNGCIRQQYNRHKSEHKSWMYYSQCLSVKYIQNSIKRIYMKKMQEIIFVYPFYKTWKICNLSRLSNPKTKIRFLSANIDISARFWVVRKKNRLQGDQERYTFL